jgi:hypothetical protein
MLAGVEGEVCCSEPPKEPEEADSFNTLTRRPV